jgi:hypothetical protein
MLKTARATADPAATIKKIIFIEILRQRMEALSMHITAAYATALAAPLPGAAQCFSWLSPTFRQPLATEAIGKTLRVFRLGEAEHHEVAVIAAQGVRELCRR